MRSPGTSGQTDAASSRAVALTPDMETGNKLDITPRHHCRGVALRSVALERVLPPLKAQRMGKHASLCDNDTSRKVWYQARRVTLLEASLNAYDELLNAVAKYVDTNGAPPDGILANHEFDMELRDTQRLDYQAQFGSRDQFAGVPYVVVQRQTERWRFLVGEQE